MVEPVPLEGDLGMPGDSVMNGGKPRLFGAPYIDAEVVDELIGGIRYAGYNAYVIRHVAESLRMTPKQLVRQAVDNEMARLGITDWENNGPRAKI